MTDAELHDLMDLALDGLLPEALQARLERHLAADADAAEDYATLQQTMARLRSRRLEQPDGWFVERLLDGLLRDSRADDLYLKTQRSA